MTILIADDETVHRAVLARMLRTDGHAVIEASDGAEALELLGRSAVDAVISDIMMPWIDGYRFCSEVRNDARWRELPFILHSASNASPADQKLGHQLGADAFLLKPAGAAEVRAALHTALDRPSLRRKSPSREVAAALKEYGELLFEKLSEKNAELAARTRALAESEERLRLALDAAGLGTWDWDLTSNRIVWGGHHMKLIGLKPEEFDGSFENFDRCVHPEDRQGVREAVRRAREARTSFFWEFRIVWPDGRVRWMASRGEFRYDADGVPVRMLGALLDFTERHALEEQLRRSQRVEAIGMISSGIAHDFNNILTPLLIATSVLRGSLPSPRDVELLDIVEAAARRGAGIVRQLLTFSRGIDGQRTRIQVSHLLREVVGMLRETFPRGIELIRTGEGSPWPVVADATQLHQVLLNLCVNARDAMPDGGALTIGTENVRLAASDARLRPGAGEGPYLLLTVRDTGQGIPREIVDRIFEPFFTTKGIGQGTGLGLSTVLGIVRSHGGFITVDSEPGRGSTFSVYLPAVTDGVDAVVADDPEAVAPGGGETVLVVDDEASILVAARHCLEGQGYRVLTAGDGRAALAVFAAYKSEIAVVVTDVMMPVMNGVEFVRALRVLWPDGHVIVAMGMASAGSEAQLGALGVTEILAKPYAPRELLDAMQRAHVGRTVGPSRY